VGKVYMIVGGAPGLNENHANDVARGSLLKLRALKYNFLYVFSKKKLR